MEIRLTHPDHLPFEALNYLKKAIEKNPLPDDPTLWDILESARKGDGEIYVLRKDQVMAAFYLESNNETLHVSILGGEKVDEWIADCWKFLKSKMREKNTGSITVLGRFGWHKIVKELKFVGCLYEYQGGGVETTD